LGMGYFHVGCYRRRFSVASFAILGDSFYVDSDCRWSNFRSWREICSHKPAQHGKRTSYTIDRRSNYKDCSFSFKEGQLITHKMCIQLIDLNVIDLFDLDERWFEN
jgi:hypothetical protein